MNRFSDSLTRQMLRNLFLMVTEITCLLKRDLNSWSKNTKWNLLTLVLMWTSGANLCSAIGIAGRPSRMCRISKRASSTTRRISYERKSTSRYSGLVSVHEMGEMKRAQELRVDEFSVQKLRESHDTIQRLTSQIQELQERVNCIEAIPENFKK